MTKWYEVDMNNAKCWAMYRKQMLEEWIDGAWELVTMVEDTSQAIVSGYCGLIGMSANSSYYITFDNIEINKKEVV